MAEVLMYDTKGFVVRCAKDKVPALYMRSAEVAFLYKGVNYVSRLYFPEKAKPALTLDMQMDIFSQLCGVKIINKPYSITATRDGIYGAYSKRDDLLMIGWRYTNALLAK